MPGSPDTMCCTVADCRMVEARWNDQAQHFEARVMRETFGSGLQNPILSPEDNEAFQAAKDAWIRRWIAKFGDNPDVWIRDTRPQNQCGSKSNRSCGVMLVRLQRRIQWRLLFHAVHRRMNESSE